jgi:hypothetical protein
LVLDVVEVADVAAEVEVAELSLALLADSDVAGDVDEDEGVAEGVASEGVSADLDDGEDSADVLADAELLAVDSLALEDGGASSRGATDGDVGAALLVVSGVDVVGLFVAVVTGGAELGAEDGGAWRVGVLTGSGSGARVSGGASTTVGWTGVSTTGGASTVFGAAGVGA